MDIQFFGANCVVLTNRQARFVCDDNLTELGAKSVAKEGDVALFTQAHARSTKVPKIIIEQPGEYEIQNVSVYGIAARSHMDEEGMRTATMYKIMADDISILITGHIYPVLNDKQLEAIGMIDVMIVPVGGAGYTLDAAGALGLIKEIEPKIVIPTHYADQTLNYPVPQAALEDALKILAIEPKETVSKLRIKPADLTDATQLVVLENS